MFKITNTKNKKVYTVYGVNIHHGTHKTQFLIFNENNEWEWVYAMDYKPSSLIEMFISDEL